MFITSVALLLLLSVFTPGQTSETFGIDEESFSVYVRLLQLSQQHGWKLELPKLAVTGIQSAGKSTLLETYMGFPAAYTARDTATRCPIQYTLRRGASGSPIEIKFKGEQISPDQLPSRLESSMNRIATESPTGFSEEFLLIEVVSPSVPNIVFVDLPGLIPNPDNREKELAVQKLVANVVRDPSFFIVAVVKCQESISTIGDFKILDTVFSSDTVYSTLPPRTDWKKKAVFVINRLNNYDDEIRSNGDANQFFAQGVAEQRFFVVLNTDNFDKDSASYEEKYRFIKELPDKETQWFEDFKEKIQQKSSRDQVWNPANDKILGLTHAKKKISSLWLAGLNERLPEIIRHVSQQFSQAKNSYLDAERQLAMANVTNLLSLYQEYSIDFAVTLNCIHTSDPCPDENFKTYGNYDGEFETLHSIHSFGTTWEEDQKHAESTFGPPSQYVPQSFLRTIIPTEKMLTDDHVGYQGHRLGKDINRKMLGNGALTRLLLLLEYYILAREVSDVDDDTIYSFASAPGSNTNNFDSTDVVLKLTRLQVGKMKPAFAWFKYYAISIFYKYAQKAHDYLLTTRYTTLREHDFFLNLVDKAYFEHIQEALRIVQSRWEQDLKVYSEYIPVDLTIKRLLSMTIIPQEDLVLDEINLSSEPPLVDEELSKPGYIRTGLHPGQESRGKKNWDPYTSQKQKAILDIRSKLRSTRDYFDLGDLVEGDHSNIYPSLWSEVNYEYLRSVSREFYMSLAITLTHSLTASVNHFFLGSVNNKAEIQKQLLAETRAITEDTILKNLDIPVEYLLHNANQTRIEYENAGDALKTINVLANSLRRSVPPQDFLNSDGTITTSTSIPTRSVDDISISIDGVVNADTWTLPWN